MSGGIAYVLDEEGIFRTCCNLEMVDLENLSDPAEMQQVHDLIERHQLATGSLYAGEILARWNLMAASFVKVIPRDYKRMTEALARANAAGLHGEDAENAAFEENAHAMARASGN